MLFVSLIATFAAASCDDDNEGPTCSWSEQPPPMMKSCRQGYLPCNNTAKCIPATWICDSWNDCGDGEDELACPG